MISGALGILPPLVNNVPLRALCFQGGLAFLFAKLITIATGSYSAEDDSSHPCS